MYIAHYSVFLSKISVISITNPYYHSHAVALSHFTLLDALILFFVNFDLFGLKLGLIMFPVSFAPKINFPSR